MSDKLIESLVVGFLVTILAFVILFMFWKAPVIMFTFWTITGLITWRVYKRGL